MAGAARHVEQVEAIRTRLLDVYFEVGFVLVTPFLRGEQGNLLDKVRHRAPVSDRHSEEVDEVRLILGVRVLKNSYSSQVFWVVLHPHRIVLEVLKYNRGLPRTRSGSAPAQWPRSGSPAGRAMCFQERWASYQK